MEKSFSDMSSHIIESEKDCGSTWSMLSFSGDPNPKPYTLHPKPQTPNPKPYTLNPQQWLDMVETSNRSLKGMGDLNPKP